MEKGLSRGAGFLRFGEAPAGNGKTARSLWRLCVFCAALLVLFVLHRSTLKELAWFLSNDASYSYSYIPLMPILAAAFLCWKRKSVFSDARYSPLPGGIIVGVGVLLGFVLFHPLDLVRNDRLSLSMCSAVLMCVGVFIGCYGWAVFRKAAFAFLLLLFVIPAPPILTQPVVAFLRRSSVEIVYPLLRLLGLPVIRDGYVLHFPNMSIVIAEECAGFNSFVALLIVSMVVARLTLVKGWTRCVVVVAVVPITMIKNALRIFAISLIVVYLGEGAFVGLFHKLVGFTSVALLLLWPIVASLRRLEQKAGQK